MKKEDIFLLIITMFSAIIIGCLAVNGDVSEKKRTPVQFLDSKMDYDTIRDGHFLTKNQNKNEETCICIRTYARNGTHIMWERF